MFVIIRPASGGKVLVSVESISLKLNAKENKFEVRSGSSLFYVSSEELAKSLATEYKSIKDGFEALLAEEKATKVPAPKPAVEVAKKAKETWLREVTPAPVHIKHVGAATEPL